MGFGRHRRWTGRVLSASFLEAFTGVAAIIKPQVAFFERFGSAGMACLEALLDGARARDLLVVADAKRGDIDSTAAAYAAAWLSPDSPLRADAVTVHPYLGLDALEPFFAMARAHGRGVFVVSRSSNPEGRTLQQARTAGGQSVEDDLLTHIAAMNELECATGASLGSIGAVIGATLAPSEFSLSQLRGVILAPGVGAQGAGPDDVARLFADTPRRSVLANMSRSILSAGPDVGDLRRAAVQARDALAVASV